MGVCLSDTDGISPPKLMRSWQSRGGQELGEWWLTPNGKAALSSGLQGKETQLTKTDFPQYIFFFFFLLASGIK